MRGLIIQPVSSPPEPAGRGFLGRAQKGRGAAKVPAGQRYVRGGNGEEYSARSRAAVVRCWPPAYLCRGAHRLLMRRYCPIASGAKTAMIARLQSTE